MYLHNKLLRMLCVHLLQQDTMQCNIIMLYNYLPTPFFLLIIGLLTHGIYQIISNQKTQGLLRRRRHEVE